MTSPVTCKLQWRSSNGLNNACVIRRANSWLAPRHWKLQNSNFGRRNKPAALRRFSRALFIGLLFCLSFLVCFIGSPDDVAASSSTKDSPGREARNQTGEVSSALPLGSWLGWLNFGNRAGGVKESKLMNASDLSSPLEWVQRHRGPFYSLRDSRLSNVFPGASKDTAYPDPETKMGGPIKIQTRLARVTVYWPGEGDFYTKRRLSSTGVRLREGHCAVDPKVIPYGSVVKIAGIGKYVAVDTGRAVVSRRAARAIGRNAAERNALVVDVFCSSRSKARALEASAAKFALVTWHR